MIVLGLDTATAATVVALRLSDSETLEARDDPPSGQHPGHATRLLGLADGLLSQAGVQWEAVERIAVGLGPGTFTGLRIGIATARGLAHSLGAELVGVSTLLVLAQAALSFPEPAMSFPEPAAPSSPPAGDKPGGRYVLAVVDARRGEAFAGAYVTDPEHSDARQLAAPQTLAPEELVRLVEQLGEEMPGAWTAVGDGALRFRDLLVGAGALVPDEGSSMHRVRASVLCEIGRHRVEQPIDQIVPEYLRRPDAELALEAASR